MGPRRRPADNTRAIPYEDLEDLWRRRDVPLREKLLWRLLYETAARTSEVLALDVGDLDRARRRARIRSKGGSTDMVVWAAPTARLLGRYLADRSGGPLFLTRWRTRTAPPRRDLYEPTGQARLSYRTAAAEFRKHSGWTLHQLRHSSLTHLAEAGASAVMLQAKSRHRDLRTLSVYTRPGVEAVDGVHRNYPELISENPHPGEGRGVRGGRGVGFLAGEVLVRAGSVVNSRPGLHPRILKSHHLVQMFR